MADEGIVENARRIGEDVLGPGLREIAERHPSVGEVRGLGVFWALDLVKDKATRETLVPYNASRRGQRADGRLVGRLQGARAAAVRQLQPAARRAAVHGHRGRGQGGARRSSTRR